MRRPRVVARLALIAVLAAVAVPGSVGSQGLSPEHQIDPALFRAVDVAWLAGTTTTTPTFDPSYRSAGALTDASTLFDPAQPPAADRRPDGAAVQPDAPVQARVIPQWRFDGNVSWYGPGFYGKRTACGYAMTESLRGVAHRTLPCGTKVTFRNPDNGRTVTARVIDRGPYVSGRTWDLTGGLCKALGHCYTGSLYWKLA
ncbi:MAG TPA: septal ring lytic transglycosylase RlpA family protein [Candidatus Limnocylindrales bacterium]